MCEFRSRGKNTLTRGIIPTICLFIMKLAGPKTRPVRDHCGAARPRPDSAARALTAVGGRGHRDPWWRADAVEPVDPEFDEPDGIDDVIRRIAKSAGDGVDPEPQ